MQYGGNVTRILGYMKELTRIKPIESKDVEVLIDADMMDCHGNATEKGITFMKEMNSVLAKIQHLNKIL